MALGIESFRAVPTGAALGATVKGVDLRDLHDAVFARIMQAWHDYSVLLFRDQTLNDQVLIAFSRRLGDLDWAPIQETGRRFVEGLPEIFIVSNVKVNGEPLGSLGDGEAVWHTDMSYLDVPPKASLLDSLEVPPTGGNTSFCTMYSIYEALPTDPSGRSPPAKQPPPVSESGPFPKDKAQPLSPRRFRRPREGLAPSGHYY